MRRMLPFFRVFLNPTYSSAVSNRSRHPNGEGYIQTCRRRERQDVLVVCLPLWKAILSLHVSVKVVSQRQRLRQVHECQSWSVRQCTVRSYVHQGTAHGGGNTTRTDGLIRRRIRALCSLPEWSTEAIASSGTVRDSNCCRRSNSGMPPRCVKRLRQKVTACEQKQPAVTPLGQRLDQAKADTRKKL